MKSKKLFIITSFVILGGFISSNAQGGNNTVLTTVAASPGQDNVLIGSNAAASISPTTPVNTGNGSNVFIGSNVAPVANTTTPAGENSRNVFIGAISGFKNTTGSDNVFLGWRSGINNTTGVNNIIIGSQRNSPVSNNDITGSSNAMVGFANGESMTSGTQNSFFGCGAGRYNTTGNYNTFLGLSAGTNNSTGNNNISIGGIGPASGSNNILVGNYSGANCSGNNNLMIGAYSGQNITTGVNNSFFGRVIIPNSPSTSLLAGNDTSGVLILATSADWQSQRIFIDSNGFTGIGLGDNVKPRNRLDIKGAMAIGTNYTSNTTTAGPTAPANGLIVEGSVGIGNSAPGNKLEITANTTNASGLKFTNLTSNFNPGMTATRFLTVDNNGNVISRDLPAGTGGSTTNTLTNPLNLMTSTVNGVASSASVITAVGMSSANNQLMLSINGINTVPVPLTQVQAGANVTVTGDGSQLNPYVVNAATGGGGGICNIYNSDGTIDTNPNGCDNPEVGLRTVHMKDNNLFFDTSGSPFKDGSIGAGRIYIGNTPHNFPILGPDSYYRLLVEGGILTEKVKVALSGTANWADYVFSNDYKLMPLKDVETYVNCNHHLPGIESAEELAKDGLDLGNMQAKQMEKIEELTLHLIAQNKVLENQSREIEELKSQIKTLLERVH